MHAVRKFQDIKERELRKAKKNYPEGMTIIWQQTHQQQEMQKKKKKIESISKVSSENLEFFTLIN